MINVNRLNWQIESQNLIPSSQTDFRKGTSYIDNLMRLTINVEEAFIKNKSILAVFLDVKGAFDNVNIDILTLKLEKIRNLEIKIRKKQI